VGIVGTGWELHVVRTGEQTRRSDGKRRTVGTYPVFHDGVIYANSGESRTAIRSGGRGDVTETHKLWDLPGGARISSPVYHDGHLYWSNDGHIAHCSDAGTGKKVYR